MQNETHQLDGVASDPDKESVASVLERDAKITVRRWLERVHLSKELVAIPLDDEERSKYLIELNRDIVSRLRKIRVMEIISVSSDAAVAHGKLRFQQNYTASLMVHESRILQACLFESVQRNLATLDFKGVLPDVMLIADEVDSQLTQAVASFVEQGTSAAA